MIIHKTFCHLNQTFSIICGSKLSHACFMVNHKASIFERLPWWHFSTQDCKAIYTPKSSKLNSIERGTCHTKQIQYFSLRYSSYSLIQTFEPWPPALSTTRSIVLPGRMWLNALRTLDPILAMTETINAPSHVSSVLIKSFFFFSIKSSIVKLIACFGPFATHLTMTIPNFSHGLIDFTVSFLYSLVRYCRTIQYEILTGVGSFPSSDSRSPSASSSILKISAIYLQYPQQSFHLHYNCWDMFSNFFWWSHSFSHLQRSVVLVMLSWLVPT